MPGSVFALSSGAVGSARHQMPFEAGVRPGGRGHITDGVADSFLDRPCALSLLKVSRVQKFVVPQAKKRDFLVVRLAAAEQAASP
jgi:hypothetical protein